MSLTTDQVRLSSSIDRQLSAWTHNLSVLYLLLITPACSNYTPSTMSSSPSTPLPAVFESRSVSSSPLSTPSASPPAETMADETYDPVSDSMRAEEEKAQKQSRAQAKKEQQRSQEEWQSAGEDKFNGQYKKLYYLLEKSKVRFTLSSICFNCFEIYFIWRA